MLRESGVSARPLMLLAQDVLDGIDAERRAWNAQLPERKRPAAVANMPRNARSPPGPRGGETSAQRGAPPIAQPPPRPRTG